MPRHDCELCRWGTLLETQTTPSGESSTVCVGLRITSMACTYASPYLLNVLRLKSKIFAYQDSSTKLQLSFRI